MSDLPRWVWKLIRNANFGDGGDGGDGSGDSGGSEGAGAGEGTGSTGASSDSAGGAAAGSASGAGGAGGTGGGDAVGGDAGGGGFTTGGAPSGGSAPGGAPGEAAGAFGGFSSPPDNPGYLGAPGTTAPGLAPDFNADFGAFSTPGFSSFGQLGISDPSTGSFIGNLGVGEPASPDQAAALTDAAVTSGAGIGFTGPGGMMAESGFDFSSPGTTATASTGTTTTGQTGDQQTTTGEQTSVVGGPTTAQLQTAMEQIGTTQNFAPGGIFDPGNVSLTDTQGGISGGGGIDIGPRIGADGNLVVDTAPLTNPLGLGPLAAGAGSPLAGVLGEGGVQLADGTVVPEPGTADGGGETTPDQIAQFQQQIDSLLSQWEQVIPQDDPRWPQVLQMLQQQIWGNIGPRIGDDGNLVVDTAPLPSGATVDLTAPIGPGGRAILDAQGRDINLAF